MGGIRPRWPGRENHRHKEERGRVAELCSQRSGGSRAATVTKRAAVHNVNSAVKNDAFSQRKKKEMMNMTSIIDHKCSK